LKEKIIAINVPQLGVNDQEAELIKWFVSNEDKISTGDMLCTLETAKAVFDVHSEASGFIVHLVDVGRDVEVNQIIALIGPDINELRKEKENYISKTVANIKKIKYVQGEIKATKKAALLAKELGIDLSAFSVDGIIREKDVLKYSQVTNTYKIDESSITSILNNNKFPLVIYSSGRGAITAKECIDLGSKYQVMCFIDDNPENINMLCGLPVYHSSRLNEIINLGVKSMAVGGDGKHRLKIFEKCEDLKIDLINIIHPKTFTSPSVKLGHGNYIKAGAIIETNSTIGDCCVIDNGVIIAHDNVIGDGVHIAPGASLGSNIKIGKLAVLGIGCSISTNIRIGAGAIISVGSSVVKDVPANAVIEGVPGKEIGKRKK